MAKLIITEYTKENEFEPRFELWLAPDNNAYEGNSFILQSSGFISDMSPEAVEKELEILRDIAGTFGLVVEEFPEGFNNG